MTAEIPPAPDGAHRLFGERRPRAEAFVAILADTGATVLVTLNALRLLAFDPEREA